MSDEDNKKPIGEIKHIGGVAGEIFDRGSRTKRNVSMDIAKNTPPPPPPKKEE